MLPLQNHQHVLRAFYDEHPQFAQYRDAPRKPAAVVVAFGLFVADLVKNGEVVTELVDSLKV